jgi:hypothetical protein
VAILGVTYALYSEGAFGAAVVTLNLLFSILIALNFYEPVAKLIVENAGFMAAFADMVSLVVLFAVPFIAMKVLIDRFTPYRLRLPGIASVLGSIGFGLAGGALAVAFLLVVLYTAPVHRQFLGMGYDHKPPFGLGIDHKLLAFFQYSTGTTFPWYEQSGPSDAEYGQAKVFDPRGSWLIDHQNSRPFPSSGAGKVGEGPTAGAAG